MKKPFPLFTLLGLCLFYGNSLFSQTASLDREVVASAGGSAFVGGKNFEYTLGESVIQTIGNGATILTQGFHQPESYTVGISAIAEASGLSVYPNPTTGTLHLQFGAPVGKSFYMQVFNATGQLVQTLPKSDDTQPGTVDCRAFPSGTYFLVARIADGGLFFQVPFIKAER